MQEEAQEMPPEARSLREHLVREPKHDVDDVGLWIFYRFTHKPEVEAGPPEEEGGNWRRAYRGISFYHLWMILTLGSGQRTGGPVDVRAWVQLDKARQKAEPHQVFANGIYHRVVLGLMG